MFCRTQPADGIFGLANPNTLVGKCLHLDLEILQYYTVVTGRSYQGFSSFLDPTRKTAPTFQVLEGKDEQSFVAKRPNLFNCKKKWLLKLYQLSSAVAQALVAQASLPR